jgi:hypothetical protein
MKLHKSNSKNFIKEWYFFILFIVIIGFFFGFYLLYKDFIKCYFIEEEYEKLACLDDLHYKIALETLNEKECFEIKTKTVSAGYSVINRINECLHDVLVLKKTIPVDCNLFEDVNDNNCYRTYQDIVIDKGDVNLCNNLPIDWKENCIVAIANKKRDINLCYLAGSQKDSCIFKLALNLNDASLCEKIDPNYTECYGGFRGGGGTCISTKQKCRDQVVTEITVYRQP